MPALCSIYITKIIHGHNLILITRYYRELLMKSEFGAPKELTSILQRKNRKINMRQKDLNFLDRNEFNYSPSKEVVEALKNFDINKLCFYTRIYDEGKKAFYPFSYLNYTI